MRQRFEIATLLFSILGLVSPVHAQATRAMTAGGDPREIARIALYPGHGLTLNFRPTGELIRKVWLDDPSQVTLDFDNASCLSEEVKAACAARVLHLRRIRRLNFPDLPLSATTSLTVVTDRTLYQFQLTFPNAGSPSTYTLDIQPEQSHARSISLTATQMQGQSGVQLLERGLQVATSRRLLTQGDALWHRVRSLLQLLKQGTPVAEAVKQAGVSQALIARLAEMGQEARP
jgi:hypothetical protein